jgi:hypothetical protein
LAHHCGWIEVGGARSSRGGRRLRRARTVTISGAHAEAIDRLIDGDVVGATRIARAQLAAARRSGDEGAEVATLLNLCALEGTAGRFAIVRGHAQRALEILGEAGDPSARALALFHLGSAFLSLKVWKEGEMAFGEGARAAKAAGRPGLAGQCLGFEGRAKQKQGDGEGAILCFARASDLLGKAKAPGGASLLEWLRELKQSMGETAYYEAWAKRERVDDYPGLRAAVASARGAMKRELRSQLALELAASEEERAERRAR